MDWGTVLAIFTTLLGSAVVSAIVTSWLSLHLDTRKWERETAADFREGIDTAATKLLTALAKFPAYGTELVKKPDSNVLADYTEVLIAHYAWEIAVWGFCTEGDQHRIIQIRDDLEIMPAWEQSTRKELGNSQSVLVREILEISHAARVRVKKP